VTIPTSTLDHHARYHRLEERSSDCRRTLRELSQIVSNLISHSAENREPFLLGTLHNRGIFKVAMDGHRFARKNRAAFLGVVANSEDIVELLAGEFIHVL